MSYTRENYSIITSLNERGIYLKITDTVSFYQYETNVDIKELRITIELKDAYTIITRCFEKKEGSVTISVQSNVMKLQFKTLVGGFLKIEFDVLLREKVMSSDGQISLHVNRLEQQLISMEKRCKDMQQEMNTKHREVIELTEHLGCAHICMMLNHQSGLSHKNFVPLNSTELTLSKHDYPSSEINFGLVKKLYRLTKLTLQSIPSELFSTGEFSSTTLRELIIETSQFSNINGIRSLPQLERLTISYSPKIINIPKILATYSHKLKYISIQTCSNINALELQTYCQANNIQLLIS